MQEFFNSEIYAYIGLVGNIITYLGLIVAIMLIKHYHKLKHFPHTIDSGDDESWRKSQEAIKYSKTKWCKFLDRISKIL